MNTEFVPPPAPVLSRDPAPAPAAPEAPSALPAKQAPLPPGTAPEKSPPAASLDAGLEKLRMEAFKGEGEAPVDVPAETPKPASKAEKTPAAKADEAKDESSPAADEPSALDKFVDPEGMAEGNKANWKKLKETAKTEINALKNERAALAKKLETYEKATPGDSEKAIRLEAQLKEVQDRLAVYDLKSHPDFRRQYVEPKDKALSEAKMLLADNGVEGVPNMADLLSKPRAEFAKTVSELAAKLPAFDQGSLVASMREAYRIHGEENNALSKSSELKQQLESKAAMVARQGFDEARTEFSTRIPELSIPEGADEDRIAQVTAFNKARSEAFGEMEKFTFGKMSEREVAGLAARAATTNLFAHHVLPAVQADLKRSNELLAQATAELAAIKKGKNPGTFSGAQEPRSSQTQNRSSKMPDFGGMAAEVGLR